MKTRQEEYLTETGLGVLLGQSFRTVRPQTKVGDTRYRVDYSVTLPNEATAWFEFDGYAHYTQSETESRDLRVTQVAYELGVALFHVPYWLQWKAFRDLANQRIGLHLTSTESRYPNGFVDPSATRPSDFCIPGWFRFAYELSRLPANVKREVHKTMKRSELTMLNCITDMPMYEKASTTLYRLSF
jgi:hypothetical protein